MALVLDLIHGRGSAYNPGNRFEQIHYEPDPDAADEDRPSPRTQFFRDTSRSIIAYNDSPDVGFEASLNPYRGCEHGCIYCYARPTHEYLGFSAGLDFESKIMVKEDAPELLRKELSSRKWEPKVVAISGVTDPYQPIERRLQITRRCLQVFAEFRNPIGIVTKNHLVARDIDILSDLARYHCAAVFVSVTSLDPELRSVMEPRASTPSARLEAIRELSAAGIPVGAMVAPVIPGLTDHEIPSITKAVANAGAKFAAFTLLRLPYAVSELFERWISQHFPEKKAKVLGRLRDLRGGRLNDPRFGSRMKGEGIFAEQIAAMFRLACKQAGLNKQRPALTTKGFRRAYAAQLEMF